LSNKVINKFKVILHSYIN